MKYLLESVIFIVVVYAVCSVNLIKKGKAWDHTGISKGNSRSLQRAGAYK